MVEHLHPMPAFVLSGFGDLLTWYDAYARLMAPTGMLDGDPNMRPEINIFTASKAPWYTITDSLPCVAEQGTEDEWRALVASRRQRVKGTL